MAEFEGEPKGLASERAEGKPTVLVLCTGNSCRSHIGEGFLRSVAGDHAIIISAGSKPAGYVVRSTVEDIYNCFSSF